MNTKGYFVKIIFNIFNPDILDTKDKVLLIAYKNWLSPKIIPDEHLKKFKSLESQIIIQLSNYSLETCRGRFVPEKAYTQWTTDREKLIQAFNNYKNDLILSYDTLEEFIKTSNKDLIDKVWNIIYPNGGKATENFIIETNKKIIDLLPSKEDLYNSISMKILVFPTVKILDGIPEIKDSDKFLTEQIKMNLINIVISVFDKIINFYNKKKQIQNNMLELFKKELNRIYLLYFCRDIQDIIKQILSMMNKGEHRFNKDDFIKKINSIKKDLIDEVKKYS